MDQSQPLSLYISPRLSLVNNSSRDGGEERAPQMCGQAVLTKILGKTSLSKRNGIIGSSEGLPLTSSCFTSPPKTLPFLRRRYEEVVGPLQSPETDSSSSSSSHKSNEEPSHSIEQLESPDSHSLEAPTFPVQFDPESLDNDEENGTLATLGIRSRDGHSPFRSMPLPSVTEESSSYDTEEQSSQEKEGNNGHLRSEHSSKSKQQQQSERQEQSKEQTQTEKNTEMIMSLRNLVHKQQAALKDLSQQNSHYCKKLGEYQNLLIKMRQEQVEKQRVIDQLMLEKDAYETDALWIREEVKSVHDDIDSDMSDCVLKSKLSALMKGCSIKSVDSPKTPRVSASTTPVCKTPSFREEMDSVNAFKQKSAKMLSPGSTEKAFSPGAWNQTMMSLEPDSQALWEYDARDESDDQLNLSGKREDPNDSFRSDSERSRTKEEVALFKQRLDSLQKKRSERQTARKESNRTVVRFGSLTC